jgi:hypothetical protein
MGDRGDNCPYRQMFRSMQRACSTIHTSPLSAKTMQRMLDVVREKKRKIKREICDPSKCDRCFEEFVENNCQIKELTEDEKKEWHGKNVSEYEKIMQQKIDVISSRDRTTQQLKELEEQKKRLLDQYGDLLGD